MVRRALAITGVTISLSFGACAIAQTAAAINKDEVASASLPQLVQIPSSSLADRFQYSPDPNAKSNRRLEVVGAFRIMEPKGRKIVSAWSPGFLPVALKLDNGECLELSADYRGGALSNGKLKESSCGNGPLPIRETPKPADNGNLQFVGSAWGMGAWYNKVTGQTVVAAPYVKTFKPLFTARMKVDYIMAMTDPHGVASNVTLVGRIDGQITAVTLLIYH